MNNTLFDRKEHIEEYSRFPFLKDSSRVNLGSSNAFSQGTAKWEDVKAFPEFKDVEWQPINEQEGYVFRCYKFYDLHKSQLESRLNGIPEGFDHEVDDGNETLFDHCVKHGYYSEQKRERVRIEMVFDSENNLFFYHFDGPD